MPVRKHFYWAVRLLRWLLPFLAVFIFPASSRDANSFQPLLVVCLNAWIFNTVEGRSNHSITHSYTILILSIIFFNLREKKLANFPTLFWSRQLLFWRENSAWSFAQSHTPFNEPSILGPLFPYICPLSVCFST